MSKALRAMQTYATPSTTDAVVQELRRSLVAEPEVDVIVLRSPRDGGEAVARAVAATSDSHLLFAGSGLTASTAYRAISELRPLALIARIPLVLVVPKETGIENVTQLMLRSRHRSLQIGTPGERTPGQLLLSRLQQQWPQSFAAVAYNGGNGALRGLLARQIAAVLVLVPLPSALPYANNRRIRLRSLPRTRDTALLSTVPTFAEAGFYGASVSGWHGWFASSAMPASEILRFQSVLATALTKEDAKQVWSAQGYIAGFGDAEILQRVLREKTSHGMSKEIENLRPLRH